MEENITKAPKPNRLDAAYHALKIVLGAVGQVAGIAVGAPVSVPASDFLAALLDAPINKRRDEWVQMIAARIVELEEKVSGFNIETLQENEKFVSAILQASSIASRTHRREKLEALANAVMRTAVPDSNDDDTAHMFMHLVDRVTLSHMVLLSYFNDNFRWSEERNAPGYHIEDGWITNFDEAFPDFKGNRFVFYAIIQDLINLTLLREKPDDSYRIDRLLPSAPGAEPSSVKRERRAAYKEDLKRRNLIDIFNTEITELGKAFLQFISDPRSEGVGDFPNKADRA
jgi:hypothetical protein